MSGTVQIECVECGATLAMKAAPEELANRKVRCPKCQTKFVARPAMIRVVKPKESASPTRSKPTKPEPADEWDEALQDAVEIDDDDDDFSEPQPLPSRSRRPAKRQVAEEVADAPRKKKSKKKSRPPAERTFGMAVLLWTGGGIIGGLLGGGLWGLVAYSTGWHVGFLSILIGTFVGIGVRLGAAQYEGWMPGVTGVLITLLAVFLSNLTLNLTLFYDDWMPDRGGTAAMSREELVAAYAEEVVAPEFRTAGKPVEHPQLDDEDYEDYSTKGMYDPAFWTEAEKRWNALPPQEQAAFMQQVDDRQHGVDRDSLIHHLAEHEVEPEFKQANKPTRMAEAEFDESDADTDILPDVLQEATRRLDAKSPAERQLLVNSLRSKQAVEMQAAKNLMFTIVLIFTALSLLWPSTLICLIIACVSAYQIGNYDGVTS